MARQLRPAPDVRGPLDIRGIANDAALNAVGPQTGVALQGAHWVLKNFVPEIPAPPLGATFVPVLGAGWQGERDLQRGDHASALFNGALGTAEVLIPAAGVETRAMVRGVNDLLRSKKASNIAAGATRIATPKPYTAERVQKAVREHYRLEKGDRRWEVHHVFPLEGRSRSLPNWRNHPSLMSLLPTRSHKLTHGAFQNGRPLGPLARTWLGANDWMKKAAIGTAAYGADSLENLARNEGPPRQGR